MSNIAFMKHFESIKDPRQAGKVNYPLNEIFLLMLCAVISGVDDFVNIELYGQAKIDFLREFLPFKNGIPTHETIGNVISIIEPKEFQRCFLNWTQSLVKHVKGVIAIDGKTLRGSFQDGNKKSAIHMVSAWACEQKVVLSQKKVDSKTNEITAIPELLKLLQIKGAIVTIDAMGCQKEISKQVVTQGADYVFALKGNHKSLYEDVELFFKDTKLKDCLQKVEKEHGRLETRQYFMCDNIAWLIQRHPGWCGLQSIGMVKSKREIHGKVQEEVRLYLTSLPSDLEQFSIAVRSHWGIENSLHWVLDVTFREDWSRVRVKNASENFSVIKRIVLNLLKQETSKMSMRGKRFKAGWNNHFVKKILMSS